MAAMVGRRKRATASSIASNGGRNSTSASETAARSAPEQKAAPSPLITTTRTSGSRSRPCRATTMSSHIWTERAFRASGLVRLRVATASVTAVSTRVMRGARSRAPRSREPACSPDSNHPGRSSDDGDDIAFLNDTTFADVELRDLAGRGRLHGDLHLHGLEYADGVALLYLLTKRDDYLPHVGHHLGNDFLAHPRSFVTGAPSGADSGGSKRSKALRSGGSTSEIISRACLGSATSRPDSSTTRAAASTRSPLDDAMSPPGR